MFLLCVVDWFDYVWFWFWLCCLGWFCSLMFQSGLGFWLLDWSFLLTVDFVWFDLRVCFAIGLLFSFAILCLLLGLQFACTFDCFCFFVVFGFYGV